MLAASLSRSVVPFAAACCVVLLLGASARDAAAITPGRAWTAVDTFKVPGHTWLAPDRMDTDALGRPIVYAGAVGGIGRDTYALRWEETAWVPLWNLGYGVAFVKRVSAPSDRRPLIWQTVDPQGDFGLYVTFVMAEAPGDEIPVPDTIAVVWGPSFAYSGAVRGTRRWAVKSDAGMLRLFQSDAIGTWQRLEVPGNGGNGVAETTLDDTTALVVWANDRDGMLWGLLRGTSWSEHPAPPVHGRFVISPQFRVRPSGGQWLGWATLNDHLSIATFRDGAWSSTESLTCAYRRPEGYFTKSVDMSQDGGEYPAVAWSADHSHNAVQTICVCVPTDSGFTVADNLPDSEGGNLPTVARDRNGDVWVAWCRDFDGMFWAHTYTTTTAGAPRIDPVGGARLVRWTLSEPAPETWWAVLRARGSGAYEPVARVRAGPDGELTWTDEAPLNEVLRYRIRRESVDKRYEWLSQEVVWDPTVPAQLSLVSAEGLPDRVILTWHGPGAGTLDATAQRRSEVEAWESIGTALTVGPDRLRYEDHTVLPGKRYAYRLAYRDGAAVHLTEEAWVEVPRQLALAIEGFLPNPTVGAPLVAFTLPSPGEVRLDVMDVAGRRVYGRNLGVLEAGRHVLPVGGGSGLSPGVYLIRLKFERDTLTARGVVTR